jgi:glycosyltransferase involved in cell wall biosynthesis
MKLGFVVQRYGLEIDGGAELHCRWVVEHLRKFCDVEVLTTQANDYITWRNHYLEDEAKINGVTVRRFPVTRTRDPERFGRIQNHILKNEHTLEDELRWLEEEGPLAPSLVDYIKENAEDYDYFVFFSYRYYHSYWGIHALPQKSILVPTAERDSTIHLSLFKDLFRKPCAFIYNSVEEKNMINTISQNQNILGDVVGVGTEIPAEFSAENFRRKYGINGDYVIYIGRIDENKGCSQLFRFFQKFKQEETMDVKLVLIGSSKIHIPDHPDILHLGFLSEEDKFSGLDGALMLMMPSFYESLSMVTLEAWALGKPVLANAQCEVLKGQCIRSNAGFYYGDYPEFREVFRLLLGLPKLREVMGKNGKKYFQDHYAWDVIENKYLSILDQLEKER